MTTPKSPADVGLYVAAAVFCERTLRETDDVFSLIRLVNTFTVEGETDLPEGDKFPAPVALELTAFISFNSDRAGSHQLQALAVDPSGKRAELRSFPFQAEGEGRLANIQLAVRMNVLTLGLHWLEIAVDGTEPSPSGDVLQP